MRLPSLFAILPLLALAALSMAGGCNGDLPVPGCDLTSACPAGQWCLFPDALCGKGAGSGTCTEVTQLTCAPSPVCGCDGKVYASVCAAATAGADATDSSKCSPPAGDFACGGSYCKVASEICLSRRAASASACVTTVSCAPIPAACAAGPTCACVLAGAVPSPGGTCAGDATAGFTVKDPGDC